MTTINTSLLTYPFDPTGTQLSNKIVNEQHIITSNNWRDFHFIVPKCAPYFEDSVKIRYQEPNGNARYLIKGKDWMPTHQFMDASLACAKPIYGSISLMNSSLEGVLLLEAYQTVGGNWVIPDDKIALILADRLHNPRITSWEQVVELPYQFPVIDHEWNLVDMVGMSHVVNSLNGIETQLRLSGQGGLSEHIANINNPHKVTKFHVGLSKVNNFAIANQAEAEAGTANDVYLTPLTGKQLMAAAVGNAYTAHAANNSNPHGTTAAQVGAYTIAQIDNLLKGKIGTTEVAYDTMRVAGMLPDAHKAWVLEGVAADTLLFNGMTFLDLKSAIQGGASANADRFDGKTFVEATALILSGTAAAASRFGGKTPTEWASLIQSFTVANATHLNNRTDVETKAWILAGQAASTALFGGLDPLSYKADVLTGTAANSLEFEGRTFVQATSEIRNGTVKEALLFGGKTPIEYRDYVLTGKAYNSERLNGYTYDELITKISSMPLNVEATSLSGMAGSLITGNYNAWSMQQLGAGRLNLTTTPSGVYKVIPEATSTAPTDSDSGGSVLILRQDTPAVINPDGSVATPAVIGNVVTQQYFNNLNNKQWSWMRVYSGGVWGAWSRFADDAVITAALTSSTTRISALEGRWTSGNVPGNDVNDVAVPPGLYYVKSSTLGTKPTGDDGFGHLLVSREGSGGTTVAQMYFDNTTNTQWTRTFNNVAWTTWDRVITESFANTKYATRAEVEAMLTSLADTFTTLTTTLNT
jgi:hypothetical protein